MPNSPLIFRSCNCIFMFQHSNVFLINVGNKIFCFFKKKRVFSFWWEHMSRGELSSAKFWGGLLMKEGEGGSDRFRFFLGGGGVGKKGWYQFFRVELIPWRTLWMPLTSLNIEYKFLSPYIETSPRNWNTGLLSSGASLISSREGASLALVDDPSIDGVTMKMPFGEDVLHWPALHPIFSYWVG